MVGEPKLKLQDDMHRPEVNNLMMKEHKSLANEDYNPLTEGAVGNDFNLDKSTATMYRTTPAHLSPKMMPHKRHRGKNTGVCTVLSPLPVHEL